MEKIVAKFGGSSLCDALHFELVREIIVSNLGRRHIVVSAPGKRFPDDVKITDLLKKCYEAGIEGYQEVFSKMAQRFKEIVQDLKLNFDIARLLEEVGEGIVKSIVQGLGPDYAMSRGEYICAKIMAAFLGFEFVDAQEVVYLKISGQIADKTYQAFVGRFQDGKGYVFPGFYGRLDYWNANLTDPLWVKILPRSGSDISGAVVAAAIGADLYENWSDSPLMRVDPRIHPNADFIPRITFGELRELAYMGASVFHEDAIAPVRAKNIPIKILNTEDPNGNCTLVVSERDPGTETVVGIAGKSGFTRFSIAKNGMSSEIGFAMRALKIFVDVGLPIEHTPTGVDIMSVLVSDMKLNGGSEMLADELEKALGCEKVKIDNGIAVLSVVGLGMAKHQDTLAKIFKALCDASVQVIWNTQDPRGTSVIVGVPDAQLEDAIRAVYKAFFVA